MNTAERRRTSAKPGAAKPANRRTILYVTLGIVVVAIIAAVGFASHIPKAAEEVHDKAPLKVGQTAPEFQAATTQGPFDLAKTDKPVLLEVFATWCPHCQRETAIINDLYTRFNTKVQFVAVSGSGLAIDGSTQSSQADVVQFGTHFDVKYPLAYDPDLTVAKAYLQTGFPTIVLIGSDKKIRALFDGEVPEATLAAKLRSLS